MYIGLCGRSMKEFGLDIPEEMYVMKLAAIWLKRLLVKGITVDDEMIELLAWILGGRTQALIQASAEWFHDQEHSGDNSELTVQVNSLGEEKPIAQALEKCMELAEKSNSSWGQVFENIVKKDGKHHEDMIRNKIDSLLEEHLDGLVVGANQVELAEQGLREYFNFNEHEAQLCTLLYACETWQEIDKYFKDHLSFLRPGRVGGLAIMFDVPVIEMKGVIRGRLSSLEVVDPRSYLSLQDEFKAVYDSPNPLKLLDDLFSPVAVEALPLEDFPVEKSIVDMMLGQLASDKEAPTHILLYGAPGTGKTSFAHALGAAAGLRVYLVSTERKQGSFPGQAVIEANLHLTKGGCEGLVVGDDMDATINTLRGFSYSGEARDKAWLNELLDRRGVRMIWIVNDIEGIEDSVKDRFSFSLEFKPLDEERRRILWDRIARLNKVKRLLPDAYIQTLAARHPVSARAISLAIRQAKTLKHATPTQFRQALDRMLVANEKLVDAPHPKASESAVERRFSRKALNIDCSLDFLMDDVGRMNRELRKGGEKLRMFRGLLFYGSPGTGKTELARHIARELERKLVVKRASDLLSPFVGVAEKNLAKAFREAEEAGAVLLLDEADSLVYSRGGTSHSWETQLVNEFLVQLELFEGIVICTTNRFDDLDEAVYRRFRHLIRFDPPRFDGRAALYESLLAPLAAGSAPAVAIAELRALDGATPGDFRVVRDRFIFHRPSEVSHEQLVSELRMVLERRKGVGKRQLGFVHS